jgi:hypothetical protein
LTSSLNFKKENIPDSNQKGSAKLSGPAIEILEITQAKSMTMTADAEM